MKQLVNFSVIPGQCLTRVEEFLSFVFPSSSGFGTQCKSELLPRAVWKGVSDIKHKFLHVVVSSGSQCKLPE